ncbi:MAG TPA: molybdopterin-dependent oxidoreductase [Anaerolineales bacterium]|nr:molybdopterin-dependent oxidoreductase [Anaerolineales bacterium]
MVNITIDDIKLEVLENLTILEAARRANIEIPTLCDHKTLIPYGGCRLCVVEVDGSRTLQPSCTLPVAKDMVIRTNTERVRAARKFILTMIFSERNHFCPYCNVTGGDCELQNSAYAEDMTHWPIQPNWKPYPVDASHPFIVLEHNRCILCRRCVRACNELVGNFTLEFANRGTNSMLIADLDVPLGESSCVSCGTCMQVCPTGTLIDKWSAYQGKVTEVDTTKTICQECSIGCSINVLTRDNRLVRIEGNWDGEINGGVICEVGRFHPMVESRERISKPMVKKDGSSIESNWEEALSIIKSKLNSTNGKKVGIASTKLSMEALDIFKQVGESLAFSTISSTENGSFTEAGFSLLEKKGNSFEAKLAQIEKSDCYLLLGEDLTKDHQVMSFLVKRTLPKGAKLIQVSSGETGFGLFADLTLNVQEDKIPDFFGEFSALINSTSDEDISGISKKFNLVDSDFGTAVEFIKSAKSPIIIMGSRYEFKNASSVFESAVLFAESIKGNFLSSKGNINSLGAAQLDMNHSFDLAETDLLMVAAGDEKLENNITSKFKNNPFTILFSSYASPLTETADVVLPVGNWLEQSGHYLNVDGHLMESKAALILPEGIVSNYDAISKLAEQMGIRTTSSWKSSLKNISVVEIN